MKQLVILSGKGGTGKTTVASALIALSSPPAFADCDVDAPNLDLVVPSMKREEQQPYYGLPKAIIDQNRCIACGACERVCRFHAIADYHVDPLSCEGCRTCSLVCPADAIVFETMQTGTVQVLKDKSATFATATLTAGSGASGKLVSEVKKKVHDRAPDAAFAIIDGSPGIGCPVMASLTGASLVLLVTEPTRSAQSDLKRVVETIRQFSIPIALCINKYDIDLPLSEELARYCRDQDIPVVGKLGYDPAIPQILNKGGTVAQLEGETGTAIRNIARTVIRLMEATP